MLQEQALFTGLVGIASTATSWLLQRWLDSLAEQKSVKTSTKGVHMKTIQNEQKSETSTSTLVTTAKIVVAILTSLSASCLLP